MTYTDRIDNPISHHEFRDLTPERQPGGRVFVARCTCGHEERALRFEDIAGAIAQIDVHIADMARLVEEERAAAAAAEREAHAQEYAWRDAVKAIRKAGVRFRQNVRTCCRGCTTNEDLGMKSDDEPYGFTFGGQGHAIRWIDGYPYAEYQLGSRARRWGFSSDPTPVVIYINHGNGAGETIARVLREHGLDVHWDGTDGETVMVHIRRPDGTDATITEGTD